MNNTFLNCDVILADLPPPPPPKSTLVNSLYCIFMLVFSLITFFGNMFVIAAVGLFRNLQKRTHVFVVAVACADIGVALFVMPFRLYEEWNGGWLLGRTFCLIVNMFDGMFCTVSMITLCCLAFDRYLAVCRPFFYAKLKISTIIGVIVACWSVSIITWSVVLLNDWHATGIENIVMCVTDGACPLMLNLTMTIFASCLTFWLPSIIMMYCYWNIFTTANRHMRAIQEITISNGETQSNVAVSKATKAAKTLGIVVGCFFVCWLPFFVVLVGDCVNNFQWSVPLKIFVMWLGYLNSMMNPFLYYMFSSDFKIAFKTIFKCRRGFVNNGSLFSTAGGQS